MRDENGINSKRYLRCMGKSDDGAIKVLKLGKQRFWWANECGEKTNGIPSSERNPVCFRLRWNLMLALSKYSHVPSFWFRLFPQIVCNEEGHGSQEYGRRKKANRADGIHRTSENEEICSLYMQRINHSPSKRRWFHFFPGLVAKGT